MRRLALLLLFVWLILPTYGQDGLNLPTELYVLRNDGRVERYGLGTSGVETVTPESEFVLDFGIAPDGNWLAYRTQSGLTIMNMYNPEDSLQIEAETADVPPIRGEGETVVWSSNGDAIAYTTLTGARVFFREGGFTNIEVGLLVNLIWSPDGRFLAAEAESNIWWIYRRVGTEMVLTSVMPSSIGTDWVSNTQLVVAPAEGGLFLMDLENNNAQTPLINSNQFFSEPFLQAPGSLLVFEKSQRETAGLGQLIRIAFDTSGIRQETLGENNVVANNSSWSPGGRLLIAFQGGVMALIDPITGEGFTLPITSTATYSWGTLRPFAADSVQLPANGYFLANDGDGIAQVWRIPASGDLPLPLTIAEEAITRYALAPNGARVAYVSDGQLWLNDEEPILLTQPENEIIDLIFSRDGRRIAFVTNSDGDNPLGGIWLIGVEDEEPQLVIGNGPGNDGSVYAPPFYRDPEFAPNINALLIKVSGSESTTLGVLDLNTGELIVIGSYDDGFWLSDGRVIAYGNGIGIGAPSASEIVVLDPNTQAAPIPLFTLPADVRVVDLRETASATLRLISAPNRPGPVNYTAVNIPVQGEATRLLEIRNLIQPQFSPTGAVVAGITHPRGALVIDRLEVGGQSLLNSPASVWDFQWE